MDYITAYDIFLNCDLNTKFQLFFVVFDYLLKMYLSFFSYLPTVFIPLESTQKSMKNKTKETKQNQTKKKNQLFGNQMENHKK